MGEELSYPAPRYNDYVVMNADNYDWRALKDTFGVFVKHLGYFNEVGPNIKILRMEPGASTTPGIGSCQQVRFVVEGEVWCEARRTTRFHVCLPPTNRIPRQRLVGVLNCS